MFPKFLFFIYEYDIYEIIHPIANNDIILIRFIIFIFLHLSISTIHIAITTITIVGFI